MNLSSSTNAHGATYNSIIPGYSVGVCYDDIFGSTYSSTSDPHACTGTNRILRLSSNSNAHAQIPTSTGYNTDVCYGNLICRSINSGSCDSGSGERLVVSLSDNTNAHISEGSDYSYKICCKIGKEINDIYFSDMNVRLDPVSEININDQVKLLIKGDDLYQKTINYKIYKDNDEGSGVNQGSEVWSGSALGQSSQFAFYSWRPSETETEQYMRFWTEGTKSKRPGKWLVSRSEVDGLSPAEIKDVLGLERVPTHVVTVNVPVQTKIRQGVAGPIGEWNVNGGGFQTELLETLDDGAFYRPSVRIEYLDAAPPYQRDVAILEKLETSRNG